MRYGKRSIAVILMLVMILSSLPAFVFAADNNEDVIKSVTYSGREYTPDADRNITIEVPSSFTGSIDLSSGVLDIEYEYPDEDYTGASPEFPVKAATLTKPGQIRAQYIYDGEIYQSLYTVSLVKSASVGAEFPGNIDIDTSADESEHAIDRALFTDLYEQNDGNAFSAVLISGSASNICDLYIGNSKLDTSTERAVTNAQLANLKVVPKAAGTATYIVKARDVKNTVVEGFVTLTVTVHETLKLDDIDAQIRQTGTLALSDLAIDDAFKDVAGSDLFRIKFTSTPSYGKLVTGYVSDSDYESTIAKDKNYDIDWLNDMTYVPSRSITRNVTETLKYTAIDAAGLAFTGSIVITIRYAAQDLTDIVASSITQGGTLRLNTITSTLYSSFNKASSSTLSYVTFLLPDKAVGKLYYNYTNASKPGTAVTESSQYYYNGSGHDLLSNVYFVPDADYTDSFYLYYLATTTGNVTLTGRILITVNPASLGDLSFSVAKGESYSFSNMVSSINSKYKAVTKEDFSYVRFTLPSSSKGTLYYNYSANASSNEKVSTNTKYYRTSGSNLLRNVSFVPNSSYTGGTFTLNYTVYDADDVGIGGQIEITVSGANKYDLGAITYTGESGKPVKILVNDVNSKVRAAAGTSVNFEYVYFSELPASSKAGLYYVYTSDTNYGAKVNANNSERYYRSGTASRLLGDVSIVPAKNYTGTVDVNYVAYGSDGSFYNGKITVTVNAADKTLTDVKATVKKNKTYTFQTSDFTTPLSNVTNNTLNYVMFSLPSSSYGTLYYDYTSASRFGARVSNSDAYYRVGSNADLISKVTFVPASDYIGTVSFAYTAYDAQGNEYSGKVVITVSDDFPFTDVDKTAYYYEPVRWAVDKGITAGTTETTFSPNASCNRAQVVTFLWRAAGSPNPSSTNMVFTDVPTTAYYYKAVLWAVEKGITNGTSKTTFSPEYAVSRSQVVTFLWRAAGSPENNTLSGYKDVSKSAYYLTAVRWAKANGITQGTTTDTFSPDLTCNRAQIVTFLYRDANKTSRN